MYALETIRFLNQALFSQAEAEKDEVRLEDFRQEEAHRQEERDAKAYEESLDAEFTKRKELDHDKTSDS